MNKTSIQLLKCMLALDMEIGLLISLIIWIISNFTYAKIYLIGIVVSLINFLVSGYMTINSLQENNRNKYLPLISFARVILIIIIAMFFIGNIKFISYYMFGFISHYILLIINCLKNRKGSV